MAATPEKIRIAGLSKRFVAKHRIVNAVSNVNLSIKEGQFICIVGPSGCGKTTLLRIIAGLEHQSHGEVVVARSDEAKPLNAMIFQENSIFPWMTVANNVSFGLRMRGWSKKQYAPVVDSYLAKVGLHEFAHAFPHQLSGGMKQRVSIARGFANDPEILLMDEPFASLDEQNKVLLQEELLHIWGETRKTVLFVTHSIDEALTLGDRILVMSARPGQIKADIAVDFPRPREVYKLKMLPEYSQLAYRIWEYLREEVMKASAATGVAS